MSEMGTAPYCLCGAPIEPGHARRRRSMCNACWDDPVQRARNIYAKDIARFMRKVDEAAERETAGLPEGHPMVPVALNRLIDEWGRT